MDEKLGRFHAKHADLKTTGTLGVLLRAKQLGILSNLKELLYELRRKGVWLDDILINSVLKLANEFPS